MMKRLPRIMDGGTGTELERLGVPMNGQAWSAEAVLTHPHVLRKVHASFLEAGAELIVANTFSASLHVLEAAGLGDSFEAINRDAVHIARDAANRFGEEAMIAGAISTTTFTGALDPSRMLSGKAAMDQYARQAEIQVQAGAELIILEMMRDVEHTTLALEGALRAGVPVWLGWSCFAAEDGTTCLLDTDIPLAQALEQVPLHKASAVGVMHTLVEHAPAALDIVRAAWSGPVFCYPHAGHFQMPHWIFQDVMTPEGFATLGQSLLAMGVDCVGGCCGISPAHIRAFASRLSGESS